jgi:hypothetical protein
MTNPANRQWPSLVVPPEQAGRHLKPGMSIYLGSGAAEPRTMVRYLMDTDARHIEDLELIQILSFGEAVSPKSIALWKFPLENLFFRLGGKRCHF